MIGTSKEYNDAVKELYEDLKGASEAANRRKDEAQKKRNNQRIASGFKNIIDERLQNEREFLIPLSEEEVDALNDTMRRGDHSNLEYLNAEYNNSRRHVAKVELAKVVSDKLEFENVLKVTRAW